MHIFPSIRAWVQKIGNPTKFALNVSLESFSNLGFTVLVGITYRPCCRINRSYLAWPTLIIVY